MSEQLQALQASLHQAREESSPQQILDLIPYSSFIGAEAKLENDAVLYWLDRRASNIGNPSLPAIHGGVIGGFLELSAAIEILYTLDVDLIPKVVDFSLDYLRPGRYKTIYASCTVLRQGKKLVNVTATAWQDNPDSPIATARCHFLIAK
ncbi:PaaI family thioesterase [Porticoccaceae bacterium]|mgnify:CR=1 FL=1|jgi:acyl-coenzyme A thioesterase PaaI-like protein|nr:PaaI family thioesterase [Porticoccaceae bacterium]MDA9919374.1 PaaI family thioesterase [Porticoccaceae bacterium]MDB2594389.1 PaaI family thioesterase [Porticoccaceae bacterium]MDB3966875.1 PaaI family thioesterase [Porticoccaceae bacterium]